MICVMFVESGVLPTDSNHVTLLGRYDLFSDSVQVIAEKINKLIASGIVRVTSA